MSKHDKTEDISKRSMRKRRRYVHQSRRQQKPVKEDSDFFGVDMDATEYYFDNGMRKVYPYSYTFSAYVKGRWMGRTILDVFATEFKSEEKQVHEKNIKNGLLTVNGNKVSPDFILGNNHLLENSVHRHENPVLATPIEVIADTADVLVVNKPASIPCHPCGRYKYNSLTSILHKEYGYANLRILYRLDRMTSGVLIMPKTTSVSVKMETEIQKRQVQKEYLARVVGEFPDEEVRCDQPISVLSQKPSMCKTDASGKPSSTTFQKVSYNGSTSVVRCRPHTGRTHQIRVHLQFLGYPIINDPLYNSPAFGENRGKGGIHHKSVAEIETELWKLHNSGLWQAGENPEYQRKFMTRSSATTDGDAATACGTGDGGDTLLDTMTVDNNALVSAATSDARLDTTTVVDARLDTTTVGDARLDTTAADETRLDTTTAGDAQLETTTVVNTGQDISTTTVCDTDGDITTTGDTRLGTTKISDSGVDASATLVCDTDPETGTTLGNNAGRMDEDTTGSDELTSSMVSREAGDIVGTVGNNCESSGDALLESQIDTDLVSESPPHKKAKTDIPETEQLSDKTITVDTPSATTDSVSVQLPDKTNAIGIPEITPMDTEAESNHKVKTLDNESIVSKDIATPALHDPGQAIDSDTSSKDNTCTSPSPKTFLKPSSMPELDRSKVEVVEHCNGCQYLFSDPTVDEMILYLHAVKYTGPDWEYSTDLPDWAADDWPSIPS